MVFKVFEDIKYSSDAKCFGIDVLNKEVNEVVNFDATNLAPLLTNHA